LAIDNEHYDLIYLFIQEELTAESYDVLWPKFDLTKRTDDQCLLRFIFPKGDIQRQSDLLGLLEKIVIPPMGLYPRRGNQNTVRSSISEANLTIKMQRTNEVTDIKRINRASIISFNHQSCLKCNYLDFCTFISEWLSVPHLRVAALVLSVQTSRLRLARQG
jgi:hypothetical protein